MGSKKFYLAAVFALGLGVTACGCSDDEAAGPAEPIATPDTGIMEGRTTAPMVPVYFAFDKSDITGDQVKRIDTNADFIKKNAGLKIRIEGNCDERGTKEYNMALGERRAQAAKKALVKGGVKAAQLSTVSFGAEKPLLNGHDEAAWAQNRRGDFVVVK